MRRREGGRHPIKAHGFEALTTSEIKAGQTMPWDRTWAVTHEATKAEGGRWAECVNFSRGAKAPHLMAIGAKLDTEAETLTFSHPDQPDLTFWPDNADDVAHFIAWVTPLMPQDRAASTGIVRTTEQGMTDSDFPSISLGNLATLRALEQHAGRQLDVRRFRINLWVDGMAPYEEFDLIGHDIQIGSVTFKAEEPIERCASTMANPETGHRDIDTLAEMDAAWGHRELGIALVAQSDGAVTLGDAVA